MSDSIETREAEHGSKMIEIKVRFWTNDLADGKTRIRPKHAWGSGIVRIARNTPHGIQPLSPVTFNSMAELPVKIEKVLIDHGITVHRSSRMRRYLD
jgi:hypothetical protein